MRLPISIYLDSDPNPFVSIRLQIKWVKNNSSRILYWDNDFFLILLYHDFNPFICRVVFACIKCRFVCGKDILNGFYLNLKWNLKNHDIMTQVGVHSNQFFYFSIVCRCSESRRDILSEPRYIVDKNFSAVQFIV